MVSMDVHKLEMVVLHTSFSVSVYKQSCFLLVNYFVLQCTVMNFGLLKSTTLNCSIVLCNTLHFSVLYCSLLKCTVVYFTGHVIQTETCVNDTALPL